VKTVVSLFALAVVVFAAREVPAQEPQGAGAQVESTAPAAVNEAVPSTVEGPLPSTVVEAAVALLPTAHPALPGRVGEFWFLPESFAAAGRPETPAQKLARGAKLIDSGDFAAALPLVTSADVSGSPLASYARYYRAVALAGLNRMPDAIVTSRDSRSTTRRERAGTCLAKRFHCAARSSRSPGRTPTRRSTCSTA